MHHITTQLAIHTIHWQGVLSMVGVLLLFLQCLLSLNTRAFADDHELGAWNMATVNVALPKGFVSSTEMHARFRNPITDLDTILLNQHVGYKVTPSLTVWQGYGWSPRFNPGFNREQRIWQQATWDKPLKKVQLTQRVRLEQRFIEGAGQTAYRARHMARVMVPVGKTKKWALVGYHETLVNLNNTPSGPKAGLNQTRTFTGVSRQLNPKTRAEAGYMLNFVNQPNTPNDQLNHVMMMSLTLNF